MMEKLFHFIFDSFPPSTNDLYAVIRGRKILTSKGRAYKNAIKYEVAKKGIMTPMDIMKKYEFYYKLIAPDWKVKKWPNATLKYRKFDLSNRIKCLEDAICESLGIDDSQIFKIMMEKVDGTEKKVEVIIRVIEDECETKGKSIDGK